LGNFKERKFYESGGLVRRLGQRCFSSNLNINDNSCVGLKELMKINKNTRHFNNKLIHIVSDPEVLVLSYKITKSQPCNLILGSDLISLDKSSLDWFTKTGKLLKAGKYKFKLARRVYITKLGKINFNKLLIISGFKDKIIQQTIYLVLNVIYEPSFLDVFYGSRPNRGNHSALKYIKFNFNGVKWCINTDIENNFLSIFHKILLNILKKRIGCSKFIMLVKKFVKVGFKNKKKVYQSN